MALAITCLGSLLSYSVDDVELTLHDDGSLTEDDAERLRQALKCRVIFRAEAEEMMSDKLDKFPHCRDYRSINVQALKLLDVPLLHDDASVAFCDSDVLFLRPFPELFDNTENSLVFMSLTARRPIPSDHVT